MNEKRNIVSVIFLALWVGLLVALMIMSPVSELSVGAELAVPDIVFSACFCAVGLAAAVIGYVFSSKTLILLSAFNAIMQVGSLACFCVYCVCFADNVSASRNVLAMALNLANPFTAMLIVPNFIIFLVYFILSVLLPILSAVLLKLKSKKKSGMRKIYKAEHKSAE